MKEKKAFDLQTVSEPVIFEYDTIVIGILAHTRVRRLATPSHPKTIGKRVR